MQATKALFWVVLIGTIGAGGFFLAFPKYRPGFVKAWVRGMKGHTPAQTPTEAMEKFRDCIRDRDYQTASDLYTGGEYKEYMGMAADPANKLAEAIDDLVHNVNDVAHINSPDGKFVLNLMEPFPKDFKFEMITKISDRDYKALSTMFPKEFPADSIKMMGDKVALAKITHELLKPGEAKSDRVSFGRIEPKIFMSLVPLGARWDGIVALKEEGNEKEKGWKIYIPVTTDLREKVDYLKANYGNYTRALDNIKYSIKHDAATKSSFEGDLQKELEGAK